MQRVYCNHSGIVILLVMNYSTHTKTTYSAAMDAYYAITPATAQTIGGRDQLSWKLLKDHCNYAIVEDKLKGGN